MPGVNGLEVLRFLRRDPPTANVPVIVVTANDSIEMRRAAHEAGATFYLVKPPMLDEIEGALNRAVALNPPPLR
jgi:CheY-like chemotaxis protein